MISSHKMVMINKERFYHVKDLWQGHILVEPLDNHFDSVSLQLMTRFTNLPEEVLNFLFVIIVAKALFQFHGLSIGLYNVNQYIWRNTKLKMYVLDFLLVNPITYGVDVLIIGSSLGSLKHSRGWCLQPTQNISIWGCMACTPPGVSCT